MRRKDLVALIERGERGEHIRSTGFIPQRATMSTLLRNKFRAPEKSGSKVDDALLGLAYALHCNGWTDV